MPCLFPHNSHLEHEIRSFQEVARSLFLQAGFAARLQLWPQACSFVATIMSAKFVDASGTTRWKKGLGEEFLGLDYLLGQLTGFCEYQTTRQVQTQPQCLACRSCWVEIRFWTQIQRCLVFCVVQSSQGRPQCDSNLAVS